MDIRAETTEMQDIFHGTEQLISIVSNAIISFEARCIATFLLGGTPFRT
jgi:hypothetical protein